MRILFIYPNRDRFPFPIAPIGILTLSSIVKERGHEAAVTDLMFSEDPKSDIEKDISRFRPDVVAISIRNYNNQNPLRFVSYIDEIKSYVDCIRMATKATVVCGGAGFTRLPKEILLEVGADYGISGEAEESFPLFLEQLALGVDMMNVPGIVANRGGVVFQKTWLPVRELDQYPFQDIGQIDYKKYLDNGGYVGIETKRGCPNACIYCDDSLIYGKKVRTKRPERVVDEMEFIINRYSYRDFYFADSIFTLPTSHFVEICGEIIERKININFEAETTPVGMTDRNVKLLKKAGCAGVFFGIDSGSARMLKALGKSFNTKDILVSAELFSSQKLPYAVCINFGGPGETVETFNETILLLKGLPDCSAVFFNIGFKIEMGTPLEEIALREGAIPKGIDYARDGLYFAKGFDSGFIKEINALCVENPGWVPLHPEESDLIGGTLEILKKIRKPDAKPAWLKSKSLFPLIKMLNK